MGQVLIRNLSDAAIAAFKTRAQLKGTSLEQELRELIESSAPFAPDERVAVSDRLRGLQKAKARNDSSDFIRADRQRS